MTNRLRQALRALLHWTLYQHDCITIKYELRADMMLYNSQRTQVNVQIGRELVSVGIREQTGYSRSGLKTCSRIVMNRQ